LALIELKNDINLTEESTDESPLFIACKFNYLKIVEILLNQKEIDFSKENYTKLNCLDIAILEGNYEICYYILNHTSLEIKTSLEKYISMNMQLNYPLFDINLFYDCLKKNLPPEKCPSFAIKNKKKKEFEGKVPDPNESWSDFFKRLMRLELYQPPLVDKNKVDNMNSLYMKFQTSLCEREYNIKFDNTVDTDDNDGDDLEKNKLNKKNKSHRNLYDKNQDLSKYNEKKKID
jgi:ankyrin repeat protein